MPSQQRSFPDSYQDHNYLTDLFAYVISLLCHSFVLYSFLNKVTAAGLFLNTLLSFQLPLVLYYRNESKISDRALDQEAEAHTACIQAHETAQQDIRAEAKTLLQNAAKSRDNWRDLFNRAEIELEEESKMGKLLIRRWNKDLVEASLGYYECVISVHKIYMLGLEEFRAKFDGDIKNGFREVPKGAQKWKGVKKRGVGKGTHPLDGHIETMKERQQRGEQHIDAMKQYGNLVESGVGPEELRKVRDTIGSFLDKILGTEKKVGGKRKISDGTSASKFLDVDALHVNLEGHIEKLDKYYQRMNPVPRSRTPHALADSAVEKID